MKNSRPEPMRRCCTPRSRSAFDRFVTRPESPYASWHAWRCWVLVGLLGLAPSIASAAIFSVDNGVFPAVGDTFHYAVDNNPNPAIVMTPPGLNQTWDFSSLKKSATWSYTMRPASTGVDAAKFPNATLVYSIGGNPTMIPSFLEARVLKPI